MMTSEINLKLHFDDESVSPTATTAEVILGNIILSAGFFNLHFAHLVFSQTTIDT